MTVGAGASVAAEIVQIAVIEGCATSRHSIARSLTAIELQRALSF
jgi:hypothetical protein